MRSLREKASFFGGRRGQAMAEYALTTFLLLGGSAAILLTGVYPSFVNAFNGYLIGFQIALTMPFP